ncbi:MAG: OmpP1/FadL family transporter [Weeksellaceae bacterium]
MKKIFITLSVIGIAQLSLAQQGFTPQYVEDLYQYNNNGTLSGTARYKGLSGAMGALGGDLSATIKNPASGAVFLLSEGVLTGGLHSSKTEVAGGNNYSDSEFKLDQVGAVLVFDDLSNNGWRNFSVSLNYEEKDHVNERIDFNPNIKSTNSDRSVERVIAEKIGESSLTNLTFSANYNDKVYVGGGVNFHSFNTESIEGLNVNELAYGNTYSYSKDYSPNAKSGEGVSVALGVIGRVTQQLRLGASYQSPTWYKDVDEVLVEYAIHKDKDNIGDYYYTKGDYVNFINDMNSGQKFTGSAAFVIGTSGLISADYTYTDYSTAKFQPETAFAGENTFIDNYMKGTSAVSIGAEAVLQDFRLRGGFRYEQSPFEEIMIDNIKESYQPFGDLTGFSLGAGYEKNGFFVDASYDMFKRDKNYLLSGNYYDTKSTVPYDDAYSLDENNDMALDALSFKAEEVGFASSLKNITEKQGNFSLSVGFRF